MTDEKKMERALQAELCTQYEIITDLLEYPGVIFQEREMTTGHPVVTDGISDISQTGTTVSHNIVVGLVSAQYETLNSPSIACILLDKPSPTISTIIEDEGTFSRGQVDEMPCFITEAEMKAMFVGDLTVDKKRKMLADTLSLLPLRDAQEITTETVVSLYYSVIVSQPNGTFVIGSEKDTLFTSVTPERRVGRLTLIKYKPATSPPDFKYYLIGNNYAATKPDDKCTDKMCVATMETNDELMKKGIEKKGLLVGQLINTIRQEQNIDQIIPAVEELFGLFKKDLQRLNSIDMCKLQNEVLVTLLSFYEEENTLNELEKARLKHALLNTPQFLELCSQGLLAAFVTVGTDTRFLYTNSTILQDRASNGMKLLSLLARHDTNNTHLLRFLSTDNTINTAFARSGSKLTVGDPRNTYIAIVNALSECVGMFPQLQNKNLLRVLLNSNPYLKERYLFMLSRSSLYGNEWLEKGDEDYGLARLCEGRYTKKELEKQTPTHALGTVATDKNFENLMSELIFNSSHELKQQIFAISYSLQSLPDILLGYKDDLDGQRRAVWAINLLGKWLVSAVSKNKNQLLFAAFNYPDKRELIIELFRSLSTLIPNTCDASQTYRTLSSELRGQLGELRALLFGLIRETYSQNRHRAQTIFTDASITDELQKLYIQFKNGIVDVSDRNKIEELTTRFAYDHGILDVNSISNTIDPRFHKNLENPRDAANFAKVVSGYCNFQELKDLLMLCVDPDRVNMLTSGLPIAPNDSNPYVKHYFIFLHLTLQFLLEKKPENKNSRLSVEATISTILTMLNEYVVFAMKAIVPGGNTTSSDELNLHARCLQLFSVELDDCPTVIKAIDSTKPEERDKYLPLKLLLQHATLVRGASHLVQTVFNSQ